LFVSILKKHLEKQFKIQACVIFQRMKSCFHLSMFNGYLLTKFNTNTLDFLSILVSFLTKHGQKSLVDTDA